MNEPRNDYQIILPGLREGVLSVPKDFSAKDMDKIRRWLQYHRLDLLPDEDFRAFEFPGRE